LLKRFAFIYSPAHMTLMAAVVAALVLCGHVHAAKVFGSSRVSKTTLDNGVSVVVKEAHFAPLVSVSVMIRAGRITEHDGIYGASHFLEHLLFESDGGRQPLGRRIEGIGGHINATTERDWTRVWCVVATPFFQDALQALADALIGVEVKEDAVEQERKVILEEIAMAEDRDLAAILRRMLWTNAYKTHPYGGPIPGTPADVRALTAEALQEYYDRIYVGVNTAVVIVGDVSADEARRQVQRAFGDMPRGTPPDLNFPEDPPPDTVIRVTQKRAIPSVLIGIAFRAPGIANKEEVCAMDVIYTFLGEGPHCRLIQRLANEEGVAFPISTGGFCSYLTQRDPGLFIVMAGTSPENAGKARRSILREIRRLAREPLSDDELARARRLLRSSYAFGNETYQDQAFSLGFYEAIDTYRFALDYENAVMAVTPEQVLRTARKYLASDNYVLATVEPYNAAGSD